eukprot:Plantae.Rhodophyta-Purpureofilum_apyrenoidigerum.ctg26238.p1 GENE.Plantae.Rhodophyta-Purpureofilum_apyrenoidigerum.ctg26238~~Plantae.Rhodophyta-Purpureofilum_apyrenoidigerum.ctg26238.p1  ORF type:complete len:292 (-),score=41.77 Plantae.Rhodophyta-Purpureofilum_apyrenoidigerum.ctg26238:303-1178(-)
MNSYDAWNRFSSRHLGNWSGRSTHVDVRTMDQVRLDSYAWEITEQTKARTEVRVTGSMTGDNWSWELKYNVGASGFFIFEDGSYCAQHEILEIADGPPSRLVVELCLTVSVTERLRCFMLYDFESMLRRVILVNEVKDELWEERNPSTLVSLVGRWQGRTISARVPNLGAGIITYNSESIFLWRAQDDTVRETMTAREKDDEAIKNITSYGKVDDEGDLTAIDWRGPEQRRTMLLNSSSYVSAPLKLPSDSPWWCGFSFFDTLRSRRRISSLYDSSGVPVSHSVVKENRLE